MSLLFTALYARAVGVRLARADAQGVETQRSVHRRGTGGARAAGGGQMG